MDKPKRGQARYFLKERTAASARAPSEAQARLLLAAEPGDDRRVLLARRGAKAEFLGATTRPPDERGHTEVVLVDHAGRRISFPEGPPPGCAPCRAALRESPVASRLALSVGDLTDGPAEAIVVQEETEAGDRFLVVLQAGDPVVTASGVWLGRDREGLRIVTQVEAVEADTDDERELAVVRSELPVVDDKLCAVRTSVDIHDLGEERPVKLDERYAARLAGAPEGIDLPRRVATLTSALDRLGDPKSASRVCRAVVARADDPEVTRHCMRRVSALLGRGDAIAAVNAGGLLAELDEKLRPAVAPLLYEAVKAVDEDPRLAVQPEDCTARPLVTAFSSRSLDDNLRIAEATLADRVDLGDVVDAVYVTGHRDFGAQTPVGGITTRWLARLKSALPGRHAAIEALLTPAPAVGGGP